MVDDSRWIPGWMAFVRTHTSVWDRIEAQMRRESGLTMANAAVLAAYQGAGNPDSTGLHLLGPLAGKVVRVAPPLIMTEAQVHESSELFHAALRRLR